MTPTTAAVAETVLSALVALVLVLWHLVLVLAPAAWALLRELAPLVWRAVEQVVTAVHAGRG